MHAIRARVLERLTSFTDPQLMSLGWSFSNATSALDQELWQRLRHEAQRRGALLDGGKTSSASSKYYIPSVPIVFESNSHIVIDKPRGLVVSIESDLGESSRGVSRKFSGSSPELQTLIAEHAHAEIAKKSEFAHGILHRLDKGTSGALLIAKTFAAFYDLRMQFACGKLDKEYIAIVRGILGPLNEWKSLESRIATHKKTLSNLHIRSEVDQYGKRASTRIFPLAHLRDETGHMTVVRVRLHTGRTHQIRVHLSSMGHPLVGDVKYGKVTDNPDSFMLHALKLKYFDPSGEDQIVSIAPIPSVFKVKIESSDLIDGIICVDNI